MTDKGTYAIKDDQTNDLIGLTVVVVWCHSVQPAQISLTSPATGLYRPSLPVDLQGFILYRHRPVVYRV